MSFSFFLDKNVLLTFCVWLNVSPTVIFALQKHCSMRPFVLLLGRFSSFSRHFKWYTLPTAFSLFFPWCTPGSASKQFPWGGPSVTLWVYCIYYVSGVFFLGHKHKTRENNNYKTYFYYLHQTKGVLCSKGFFTTSEKSRMFKGTVSQRESLTKMRDIFSMVVLK